MLTAKELYASRHGSSMLARLARAATWVHQNVRPTWITRLPRNQQEDLLRRYFPESSDVQVVLLGSNLPKNLLTGFASARLTQVDLKPLPNVDLVADAEHLSEFIPRDSIDYVVSTSMLEHTPHPDQVVREVFRILRPGGIFYLAVPWMFPLHGEPQDYWRFSLPGVRTLVQEAGFAELESGSECSPHAALHNILKTYLCEVLSFDNSLAFYSLEFVFDWALAPLALLEKRLRLPDRHNFYTDSLIYIVGRKP